MQKFDTNGITNSKIADKMAAVQGHGCISSVYISFYVVKYVVMLIAFRRMPASMLGFLVNFNKRLIKGLVNASMNR